MLIDIFSHVMPRSVFDRLDALNGFGSLDGRVRTTPQLWDTDARFRLMDEFPDYRQIVSLSGPALEEVVAADQAVDIARAANDEMADLVRRHPDRFPGFVATLGLDDIDAAMREVDRAIDDLGACGVQLFTHVGARPLDDPAFEPVFAALARHGLPVWLHPSRTPDMPDYAGESESLYDMWQTFGWPYATAVTVMRLIITGMFDRHPGLRLITHHMGGMIPFHPIRAERALLRETSARKAGGRAAPLRGAPLDYLRSIYADTAMAGSAEAVRFGLDYFGPNRVVFASDYPFNRIHPAVDMLERLGLSDADKRKVASENAIRLCRGRLKLA